MNHPFLDIPWTFWGALCVIIGMVYTLLWPRAVKGVQRSRLQHLVIRWFHSIVWYLLAAACFIRTNPENNTLSNKLALLGLLFYLIFIGTLIYERYQLRKNKNI
ncbi:MAG TPA: hypothetical protein VKA34_12170 [Balneolales bacterium]|nr:hypothetical protein [Balneolales bacterium]